MRAAALVALLVSIAAPAASQAPSPTPEPPSRLFQDELDLQAQLNVVQGSGARAFGMGGAFLARADDATAASWNPAGLSYLRLPEVSFVWAASELTASVTGAVRKVKDDHRKGQVPDFFSIAWPFELGPASGSAQVSFQRVISFANERTIEEAQSAPRHVDSQGGFDVLALGSGIRFSRSLRAGLVVNHWFNGYQQTIDKTVGESPSRQKSDFSLSGWNVHLGAIWSPWESLNLGGTVKTGFTSDVALKRSRVDTFPDKQTQNAYSRDDLTLTLPGAAGLGASWRPRSNLTLSLDYTRSFWSDGEIRNFFTLQRTPPVGRPPVPEAPDDFFPRLPYPTLNDPRQKDAEQVRAGIEYVVLGSRLKWPLRAGYFTDRQYFRAQGGEAPRFTGLTAGTGLIVSRFLVDVAYVYEHGDYADREGLANTVRSHRIYASVIYRHPRRP